MSAWKNVRTVELVQAFMWVCDECGHDNFERATRLEPESMEGREVAAFIEQAVSEANEAAEDLGLGVGGHWLVAPSRVKCKHCDAEFDTSEGD